MNGQLAELLLGSDGQEKEKDEWGFVLKMTSVFGRTNPEQKAIVVQGLQRTGATVMMVGDGANDC